MTTINFGAFAKQCDAHRKIMSTIKDLEGIKKLSNCSRDDLALAESVIGKLREAADLISKSMMK